MFSLLLTILCSTSIALILKVNHTKNGAPIILLAGNYLIASIISLLFLLPKNQFIWSVETLIFGAILGLLFLLSFFAFAKAVSSAGAALASVSSRLSVIIPIILSIIIFHEQPNLFKIIGFIFTLVTIFLFFLSLKNHKGKKLTFIDYFFLCAVLVGIGINDFALKIFQSWRPIEEKAFFLFSIFTFAFIFSVIYMFLTKTKFEKNTALRGITLGIPNIFSSFFLIGALNSLPAIIVYPIISISVILLTAIAAIYWFNEKVNSFGRMAIVAGLLAIIMLAA